MFFAPSKGSSGGTEEEDAFLDGSCWESARSSWIYMEMEPRQRSCGISSTSEKCPEFRPSENVSEMVEDAADINILKADTSESSEIVFNNTNYQEPVHEGDEEEEEEEEEDNQNISFQSSFRLGFTASLDTSTIEIKWSPDISRDHHISNLEFVNGRTTAVGDTEEEQQDTEADYEEIGDLHELGDTDEHQYAILSNDNFVLQKDERHAAKGFINVVHTSHAPEHHDKICRARRSVSLDMVRPPKLLMRQSETVHFPPSAQVMCRALPPVPQTPASPLEPPSPPLSPVPVKESPRKPPVTVSDAQPISAPVRPAYLPWREADGVSVRSLGAFSTTTSGSSLYRIPAKVRKVSCSTPQTINTNSTSSPGQASTCSVRTCDSSSTSTVSGGSASRIAVDVLNGVKRNGRSSSSSSSSFTSAQLPRIIRDVFSFLWSDNPDRDPFNTFSVSETDLTSAIAHLESQLSSSVRGGSNRNSSKSRADVLASFAWTEAPTKEKRSPTFPLGSLESNRTDTHSSSGSDPEDKDGTKAPEGPTNQLPFRVQFIMESYCNIYMMR